MRLASLVASAVLFGACAGKRTDPGGGSRTLTAQIEIEARAESTSADVELTQGGSPVAGANVVLYDVDTNQVLTLQGSTAGSYKGTLPLYHRTLRVKITSGDDNLSAQLEGPSPHVITRPPNDAIVRRAGFTNLRVEWRADSAAERVVITPEGIDPITLEGDPFTANIPLTGLKDQEQSISVSRETSVDLAGGTSGSRMVTRYKVDNRFTLEG